MFITKLLPLEIALVVASIMVLDLLRKSWRGWPYYGLAFLMVLGAYVVEYIILLLTARPK